MSTFGQRWLAAIPAAVVVAAVTWCRMERELPKLPEIRVPRLPDIQWVDLDPPKVPSAPDAGAPAVPRTWPAPHAMPAVVPEAPRTRFPVKVDGKYGYIDARGTLVIQPRYGWAIGFEDGRALVGESAKGFIDESGTMVVPGTLTDAVSFLQGLAGADRYGRWGFIDRSGAFVVPPVFDYVGAFFEGYATVQLGSRWNFISRVDASLISPDGFESVNYFGGGLGPIELGGKWGYVDPHGTIVIAPQFDKAWPFESDRAPVLVGDKWGYIDRTGAFVVTPRYDDASHYIAGLATVEIGTRYTVIDAKGKPLFAPISVSRIWFESDTNLAAVRLADGRAVLIDRRGHTVLEDKRWTSYDAAGGGLFMVTDAEEREGYIDRTGRVIWKPTK